MEVCRACTTNRHRCPKTTSRPDALLIVLIEKNDLLIAPLLLPRSGRFLLPSVLGALGPGRRKSGFRRVLAW